MTKSTTLKSVLLCLALVVGCHHAVDTPTSKPVVRKPVDPPKRLAKKPKVLTDEELEEMASHVEREGIGANFYYHELRLRKEAKWAREELERRKGKTQ
jgi:integrase